METGGSGESHPPVENSIFALEKGEVGLCSSRRPTPQKRGEAGDSTNMEEEDGEILVAPAPVKEEDPVAEGGKALTPEAVAEMAENFFTCVACRCLLCKPAVIACGHMLCVGCAKKHMNIVESSKCPICKKHYNYLPRSCELIDNLVRKLQPLEVRKRATQEATQEAGISKLLADLLAEHERNVEPICVDQCSVQVEDVSCVLCQNLLYKPAVLNCGHVFCISCVPVDGETIKCPTCGIFHPSGPLAVCTYLDSFIKDLFPTTYKSRIKKAQSFSGGRYSCKICVDFDLCEKCAKTDSPVEGHSGQQHLPDHILELNNSFLLSKVLDFLEKKRNEQEQGTWVWQPSQYLPQVGLMRWDEGQQAPQDDYDYEPEDTTGEGSESDEDGGGSEDQGQQAPQDDYSDESEDSTGEGGGESDSDGGGSDLDV